jgi:xylitol oxidase
MADAGWTWARTHRFGAKHLVDARSVDDVIAAVRSSDGPVKALGTRHSFSDIADTAGTLVTVTGIPGDPVLDEVSHTVTVGAGARYGELAPWLQERGWALHNMGSLPHISIGGATAAGTHGSGLTLGSLSTAVAALEYVGADGELHQVRRGDSDFDALVVGLGAFGITTRITLDIEPTYDIAQHVYRAMPWEALLEDPRGVFGAAYSVSVFTMWDEPSIEQVWVKSRLDADASLPRDWMSSRRVDVGRTSLAGGDPAALTPHTGQPGPWLERLPHFRLEFTPSNGDEIQTEYFVPFAQAADAIGVVRELASDIAPHLHVTELRTIAAGPLWLSGEYERETLCIHFTWRNRPGEVAALTPRIEAALAPFVARPHWGKVNSLSADAVAAAHPRLADARDVFERLDPDGRFSSEYLQRIGVR